MQNCLLLWEIWENGPFFVLGSLSSNGYFFSFFFLKTYLCKCIWSSTILKKKNTWYTVILDFELAKTVSNQSYANFCQKILTFILDKWCFWKRVDEWLLFKISKALFEFDMCRLYENNKRTKIMKRILVTITCCVIG